VVLHALLTAIQCISGPFYYDTALRLRSGRSTLHDRTEQALDRLEYITSCCVVFLLGGLVSPTVSCDFPDAPATIYAVFSGGNPAFTVS
jgi:hypothetical protein